MPGTTGIQIPPPLNYEIKPPQVETLGDALAKSRLREAQIRQLQLENQQKQSLIERQKQAVAPVTDSSDLRSFGLYNGRLWAIFTKGEKTWYVVGFNEGLRAGSQEKIPDYFASVSFGDVISAVDRFYSEPENILIPVTDSLMVVRSAFNGMPPEELAKYVADFRRASISDAARTGKE
jgi:hypothetical protein